jgi:hypothetical protein
MAGFVTTTIGSIGGLIEGFTGLEASQVAASRAEDRVNTSTFAAQKAQEAYNTAVQKFGPNSLQAQDALTNLHNKQNALETSQERAQVTQSRLNEAYLNFGLEVITVAGELAQMGSTVSILVGKLGIKTAATIADTESNAANAISAEAAAASLETEGAAAGTSAEGTDIAAASTAGLGAEFLAIAAPIVAAVALIGLIETNTFGMGDAFRSVTPQIGGAIDALVNGVAALFNAFIRIIEVVVEWQGNFTNAMIDVSNSWNTFLDGIVVGATNLGQDLQNIISAIPNFFIDNVINPIIAEWNNFNLALEKAWNDAVNKIADLFKPIVTAVVGGVKTIVDAFAAIPGAIGDPFRTAQDSLKKTQDELAKTGTAGGKTGADIVKGFEPVPKVADLATTGFQHITTSGLFPLNNAYVDTTGTLKLLDSAMIQNVGNIKTGAAGFLNYASQGQNVVNVFKSQLIPGIASILGPVQAAAAGMLGLGTASNNTAGAATKEATAVKAAAAAHKDFAQQLTDTIAKENSESDAMLKSINNGQQYQKTLADLNKAYADVSVKLADNIVKLTDATAIQQRHATAILDGTNKALDFGIKIQDDATATEAYNKALDQATGFSNSFGQVLPPTTKNLEDLSKALAGDGKAAEDFMQSYIDATNGVGTASQKLVDDVAKAFDDIGKSVTDNDALAKIPPALEKVLSPEALDVIALEGRWKAVTDNLVQGFSAEFLAQGNKFSGAGLENVQRYIEGFGSLPAAQAPQIQDFLSGLEGALQTASTQSEAAGKLTIEKFLAGVEAQGGGAAQAAAALAKAMGIGPEVATLAAQQGAAAGGALAGGVAQGTATVPPALQKNVIDPFTGLPSTAQAVGLKVAKAFTDIGQALTELPGFMADLFARAFVDSLLTPLAANVTAIRGWLTGIQGIINAGVPPLFTKSFATAVQNASGSLNNFSAFMKGTWLSAVEAPVKAFVTFANQQFATIKPPPLPTQQAGPITPTTPVAGPQTPIKIPAPDLTAFEAGLAKMQLDATNAFAAIVNLAKIQFTAMGTAINTAITGTATAWTSLQTQAANAFTNIIVALGQVSAAFGLAFTQGAANAIIGLNSLQANAATAFANIITALGTVEAGFALAFNTSVTAVSVALNSMQTLAATAFANIITALGTVEAGFALSFNTSVTAVSTALVSIQTLAADAFAAIITALGTVEAGFAVAFNTSVTDVSAAITSIEQITADAFAAIITAVGLVATGITTAFSQGTVNAATSMNALTTNVNGNTASMILAVNAFAIAITSDFNQGTANAAKSMNALTVNMEGNVTSMILATNAFAQAITKNFGTGANNAAGSMNGLASNVASNVNTMISRLNNVITEFNNITSSINRAKSAVDALKNDINSIPTSRTVTINVVEHITQVVHITPVFGHGLTLPVSGSATAGTATTNTAETRTTTLGTGLTPTNRSRVIKVEISEPTVVKINERELLKQINKKLLELDIGALA